MSDTFAAAALTAARLASAALGWPPDIFWTATPADLCTALGLDAPAAGLDAPALARLMEAFPDG